jgi:GT2 family glycosyltransferase
MTRVDVIIPTLNGSDWLARCLDALSRSTFTDTRLIVFDDGSSEPIEPVVHARYRQALVYRSARTGGLARAFNIAIGLGASEYVVLLNNDTEPEPEWLGELVACADRHPDAGSVASKMRLLSDRRKLHSAGDQWSARGIAVNRGVWLDDFGQYDLEGDVFSACGGAALYRRTALDQIRTLDGHVFNERMRMYLEDIEIGWRLQARGWRCVFAPDAVVYHALSATGGGPFASRLVARNLILLLTETVPAAFVRPHRSRILACQVGRGWRAMRHAREPAARATLRGMLDGLTEITRRRGRRLTVSAVDHDRIANLLVHAR